MLIFLSYKINSDTPIYGGGEGFASKKISSIEKGDTANTSQWMFSNHLGTHIDFPRHFHQNGQTIEDFSAGFWFLDGKKIQTLDIKLPEKTLLIEKDHFEKNNLNFDAEFLIFKTGCGIFRNKEKYWKYNPGISGNLSKWVIKNFKNLRILGIDSISISSWQHRDIGRKVHKELLDPKKPILFIEDMDLSKVDVNTRFKKIYISPLRVSNSDGCPCTIFAEAIK